MMRTIYGALLGLHPREFRRKFAAEMMLIFEEQAATEGAMRLIGDGVRSLGRQWLLRSGAWKLVPAVAITWLQGYGMGRFWHDTRMHLAVKHGVVEPRVTSLPMVWCLVLFTTVLVVLLVGAMAFRMSWILAKQMRGLVRRRGVLV
jgi:hypothetical protein